MATRNQVKIISNSQRQSLAFYYKGDVHESWQLVTNASNLSRKEYICAFIRDRAKDIVCEINSDYNQKNRGVDIFFEGDEADFLLLKKVIDDDFYQSDITCVMQKTRIAVSGKIGAGKTTLIKGFWEFKGKGSHCCEKEGVFLYTDDEESSVWYEIPGIDFGAENVDNARKTFEKLAKSGLTTFIYCLGTTKIESLEEDLIFFVRDNYPSIKVLVVLTQFVDDEQTLYVEQLSAALDGIKVIPTLAVDMKTRGGVVYAYGLDDIDRYIFEGK